MDFTEMMAKQIEAENPAPADETPTKDARELIESAVSQVKAEMQKQIDEARARADELEKRLNDMSKPSPADPGTDNNGGNENA